MYKITKTNSRKVTTKTTFDTIIDMIIAFDSEYQAIAKDKDGIFVVGTFSGCPYWECGENDQNIMTAEVEIQETEKQKVPAKKAKKQKEKPKSKKVKPELPLPEKQETEKPIMIKKEMENPAKSNAGS